MPSVKRKMRVQRGVGVVQHSCPAGLRGRGIEDLGQNPGSCQSHSNYSQRGNIREVD